MFFLKFSSIGLDLLLFLISCAIVAAILAEKDVLPLPLNPTIKTYLLSSKLLIGSSKVNVSAN